MHLLAVDGLAARRREALAASRQLSAVDNLDSRNRGTTFMSAGSVLAAVGMSSSEYPPSLHVLCSDRLHACDVELAVTCPAWSSGYDPWPRVTRIAVPRSVSYMHVACFALLCGLVAATPSGVSCLPLLVREAVVYR